VAEVEDTPERVGRALAALGRLARSAGPRSNGAVLVRHIAELERRLDAASLESIEARNPGIDMDEVRASRKRRAT
jgi:hypothetical protein